MVIQPGKVAFPETHEVFPFIWFMINNDEILSQSNVSSLSRNTSSPFLMFSEFAGADVGNVMRECRRLAIDRDPRLDKTLTLLAAKRRGEHRAVSNE